MKRVSAFILAIVLLFSVSSAAFACDENQSDTVVAQILFGDRAQKYSSNDNVKMLLAALYLCSEQSGGSGQAKIDYLKQHHVTGTPSLSSLNIKAADLLECSHNKWAHVYLGAKKNQANRKTVLQRTVNKVFDFGLLNNLFGRNSGKCNSFAALLYYSHILADYLADDTSDTAAICGEYMIPEYSGSADYIINGDMPNFTAEQMSMTEPYLHLREDLDDLGRCNGAAFAVLNKESADFIGPRPNILPDPTGWRQSSYPSNMVPNGTLYDRSHLIGRQFCGIDNKYNLIIGTKYLNQTGMKNLEDQVKDYIEMHPQNHVLYRVTPIYKGDNLIPSGVQMEAYSVEDSGGICFNRYCYNVQPGVEINYATGENSCKDQLTYSKNVLPFAVSNANEDNPDLIFEMNKHLAILFADQESKSTYISMMNEISSIANKARSAGNGTAQSYVLLKQYQYEYFGVLRRYIPLLLKNEKFFQAVFK